MIWDGKLGEDTTVTVGGVFTEADVAREVEFGELRRQQLQCFDDRRLGVVGRGATFILQLDLDTLWLNPPFAWPLEHQRESRFGGPS